MRKTHADVAEHLSVKLMSAVIVFACLVVGLVGLILPIVPGLLFLAVAALLAARRFPRAGAWLRSNRSVGKHLDRADGVLDLPFAQQLRLAGWVCVKTALDGIAYVGALVLKRRNPTYVDRRYR